jgi:hypothetical protein
MRPTTLSLILLFFLFNSSIAVSTEVPVKQPDFHIQVLQYLKRNSAVVAQPLPDIHPVRTVFNEEAIIPPQCYTRTEGQHNPCYVCHQDAVPGRENTLNDGALQVAYSFSEVGLTNHWSNLFEDRRQAVADISDEAIIKWTNTDNYSDLAPRLKQAGFDGWIPDLENLQHSEAAFDHQGFALDGSDWVAFNYKPLPSTFWPTNGSTDDVMIRLPLSFRTDKEGRYSRDIYRANLAIVEAKVKGFDRISALPIDEKKIAMDLDQNGRLEITQHITKLDRYIGAAESEFIDSYLYPQGTEFLHTVRYVGIGENDDIKPSRRMKEVRYMVKSRATHKAIYRRNYQLEGYAKELGQLPQYTYLGDKGIDNGFGWAIQGFIENAQGQLRTLTFEENLSCMGCHTSIGSTIDKSFSFPRKVDGTKGWGYINLKGMPDAPNLGEQKGEIATYLQRVGGGGEFRSNEEMFQRWFNDDGSVNNTKVEQAADVYELITPSKQRALQLNKAYRAIVAQQDYIYGRDATVLPPANVYDKIDNDNAPTLPPEKFHSWDIRLQWDTAENKSNPTAAE